MQRQVQCSTAEVRRSSLLGRGARLTSCRRGDGTPPVVQLAVREVLPPDCHQLLGICAVHVVGCHLVLGTHGLAVQQRQLGQQVHDVQPHHHALHSSWRCQQLAVGARQWGALPQRVIALCYLEQIERSG
jgi:hypothetical protein